MTSEKKADPTAPREFWIYQDAEYGQMYCCDYNQRGFIPEKCFSALHVREVTQAPPPVKVQRYDVNYDGAAGEEDTGRFVLYEDIKHLLGEDS